ncbi:Sedoheptulokinase [Willisornis vidua]|uniref:Sedoheptulokinase n=1 Tax=Willisornis vidua TaxID=1566151 RepID=A0ABQ9D849_9PASS|nr:Sedoheptulokinase [Willisornis vidua]
MVGAGPAGCAGQADSGPEPPCVLGIDLGTTSVKAALVTGTERALALAQRDTRAHTDSREAGPQVAGGQRVGPALPSSHRRLEKSGFPVHLLPEVGDPGSIAGRTISAWHGIPKGAKVGIALGDFQCSVYSCLTERTDAVLNISTSAQLTVSMPPGFQPPDTPDPSSAITYFPYFNGDYLAVAASLNGGNVLAAFVGMVAQWTQELGKSSQGELKSKIELDHQGLEVQESAIYTRIIQAALAQTHSTLSVHPTIFGERHTPEQLASVTNIAASELSLGHVTRALCHGLVQNLCSMLPVQHLRDVGVRRVLGSGSALARNEVLRQEVERIFPFPVVYGKDVDAAVGAAMVLLHGK